MVDVPKPDLPDLVKYWEKQSEATDELLSALEKKMQVEPSHLEKLSIEEKNSAKDDNMPIDEGELATIMEAHKAASPFGADVAAAQAKWIASMKE